MNGRRIIEPSFDGVCVEHDNTGPHALFASLLCPSSAPGHRRGVAKTNHTDSVSIPLSLEALVRFS